MTQYHNLTTAISWALYSLCGLILAFFLSWMLLAQFDFGYSLLHDTMKIQQHSNKYGPQNRYRKNFQLTDKQEKVRLFAAINTSIHNHSEGLSSIKYQRSNGKPLGTLLHHAEIVHLKDVANLLDVLKVIALFAVAIWIFFIVLFSCKKISMPNFKQQILGIIALILIAGALVWLIGPVSVFYAFHEWIFPDNHKWFFYYQESLMTILMKAPDLFGAIALFLTGLALIFFIAINAATYQAFQFWDKKRT